jgi:hypothetical protein
MGLFDSARDPLIRVDCQRRALVQITSVWRVLSCPDSLLAHGSVLDIWAYVCCSTFAQYRITVSNNCNGVARWQGLTRSTVFLSSFSRLTRNMNLNIKQSGNRGRYNKAFTIVNVWECGDFTWWSRGSVSYCFLSAPLFLCSPSSYISLLYFIFLCIYHIDLSESHRLWAY